jgi:hypothetical protein
MDVEVNRRRISILPCLWLAIVDTLVGLNVFLTLTLIVFVIVPALTKLRHALETTVGLLLSPVVSIPAIFLSSSILSASKLVDGVRTCINLEHSLHNLDCLFASEHSSLNVVDGEVLYFSVGHGHIWKEVCRMQEVLCMIVQHDEAFTLC